MFSFSSHTLYPGAEYLDVGLKVKATPRIHPNREVSLQLDFELSSLSTQSFNSIPVINNETVNQTVRVRENETSVLAGILEPQLTNIVTGTPGIAQIPGLGYADSNLNRQRTDTELLILVTPREVREAKHKNASIYAGTGSIENGAAAPAPAPPPQPQPVAAPPQQLPQGQPPIQPGPAPAPEQPGTPQPQTPGTGDQQPPPADANPQQQQQQQ